MGRYADAVLASEAPAPVTKAKGGYAAAILEPDTSAPEVPPTYDTDKSAGLGATAVASLASDPAQRIPYYAKQRGIPEERYKVVGTRVAYQDGGKWFYEESPNLLPHSFTEGAQQIAEGVGGIIPAVTGGTVGVVSAPLTLAGPAGMAVSAGATGSAAAAGEALRQYLADKLVSPGKSNRMKIATEGLQGALGQGLGAGMSAIEQRMAVPDIGKYSQAAADALEAKAKALGITLTPAELTNLASLKGQQKMLGNMPQTADEMAGMYERRQTQQVAPAVDDFLNTVSPQGSAEVAGMNTRKAATGAIQAAKTERTKAVTPAYNAVVHPGNVVDPAKLQPLLTDEFFTAEIAAVKNDPLFGMKDLPDTSLPVLDQVKKNLDYAIKAAKKAGDGNRARLLEQRRTDMLATVDKEFPDYPTARALFAQKSPEVEAVANSVLGVVSKLKDTGSKRAAAVIFGEGSSPEQIAIARKTLSQKDPAAWQEIKRAWMQSQWTKAGKEPLTGNVVNQGAKWRQLLLGDDARKANMKAALDPHEYTALQDLADVLEATGRVKPVGSDTAWNEEMKRLAREQASPTLVRWFGNAISPQQWGALAKDWATERSLGKHAADVARIIQQPDARRLLQELKVVSPKSAKFKAGVGHLLTQFGASSVGRTGPTKEDQSEDRP